MTAEIRIDADDVLALSRAIANLPGQIRGNAMARAMVRLRDMARTRVVKRSAERTGLTQKRIRQLTTATFNAGSSSISIVEKSGWIPLYDYGARKTKTGIRIRGRGSYKSAFIAKMKSGHRGVFKRLGDARLPVRELFGANPAHDVTNNPEVFEEVLAKLIEEHLAPRILHELDRLLPR